MSADSLQSALEQGQSIAGLAEAQGGLERMVDRALDRGRPAGAGAAQASDPEAVAPGTYARSGRVPGTCPPVGGTISLLA